MSANEITYLLIGALIGGFANGFAGMGTSLFAMGFFLTVLEPRAAVATIAPVSVLAGLQGVWLVRREIRADRMRVARFILPGLAGVPIGIACLSLVDAAVLRVLIAILLILYGGYFGFRRGLPRFHGNAPRSDIGVGLISGILGGLASLSGALLTLWLSLQPRPKAETRAVLQPFNVTILAVTVALLALSGAYDRQVLMAFAIAFPAALVSAQVGIYAFRRVSDDIFRRTLIILCLALGTTLLLKEFAAL